MKEENVGEIYIQAKWIEEGNELGEEPQIIK